MSGLDVLLGLAAAVTVIGGAWALFKWTSPKVVAMSKRLLSRWRKRRLDARRRRFVRSILENSELIEECLRFAAQREIETCNTFWGYGERLRHIETALESYGKWKAQDPVPYAYGWTPENRAGLHSTESLETTVCRLSKENRV